MGDTILLGEVEQSIYRAEVAALKAQATALSVLLTSEAFPPGITGELLEWLQHAANDLHYAYGIVRRAKEQVQARQDEPAPSPQDEPSQAVGTTASPPKPKRKSSKRTR